jgi:hypothetical protein
MTPEQMKDSVASRNALLSELNRLGLRVLAGSEDQVIRWFTDKNVTLATTNGFLEMKQADGSDVTPSRACVTLRNEHPEFFASNVRYDKVSSLEDLQRGTPQERLHARMEFINKFGLDVFENLPKTRALAELKSCEIGPGMTRREYLALSRSEKIRLIGIIGDDGIRVIMSRQG